jgi:hypothetical protein
MNRRAFLKWLTAASAVILVAPPVVVVPHVEPVAVVDEFGPIAFNGIPFVCDPECTRGRIYMITNPARAMWVYEPTR